MKRAFKLITLVCFTSISLVSCNSNAEKKQQENAEVAQSAASDVTYKVGDHLPNELVCMVNNAYMGTSQMPVPVDGKIYYGCCEMCVGRLNGDESARLAIDPFSGKQVDKAKAYIVLANDNGKVEYFESQENFNSYRSK